MLIDMSHLAAHRTNAAAENTDNGTLAANGAAAIGTKTDASTATGFRIFCFDGAIFDFAILLHELISCRLFAEVLALMVGGLHGLLLLCLFDADAAKAFPEGALGVDDLCGIP